MRYLKIFLLYFERVFVYRARNIIWFLISFINPLILLLYWLAYYNTQHAGISLVSEIVTYYILLMVSETLLMSHVEETIAYRDIQLGELSASLLKPFPYSVFRFLGELPFRIFQGFLAILVVITALIFFGNSIRVNITPVTLISALVIAVLAYTLAFLYKMVLGLTAFWITEFSGLNQLVGIVVFLFGGYIMPIAFYPAFMKSVAYFLPFSYMIYFPTIAASGKLSGIESLTVILQQIIWITIFYLISRLMFNKGVKKFTGVGN